MSPPSPTLSKGHSKRAGQRSRVGKDGDGSRGGRRVKLGGGKGTGSSWRGWCGLEGELCPERERALGGVKGLSTVLGQTLGRESREKEETEGRW